MHFTLVKRASSSILVFHLSERNRHFVALRTITSERGCNARLFEHTRLSGTVSHDSTAVFVMGNLKVLSVLTG